MAYSCQHPPPTPTIPAPVYAHANPLRGSGCVADAQRQRIERKFRNYSPQTKSTGRLCGGVGSFVVTHGQRPRPHNTYAYKRPRNFVGVLILY